VKNIPWELMALEGFFASDLREIVEKYFIVTDYYTVDSEAVFAVSFSKVNVRECFYALLNDIKPMGFIAALRSTGPNEGVLKIVKWRERRRGRKAVKIILLVITAITCFAAGYFMSKSISNLLIEYGLKSSPANTFQEAAIYTVSLLGILGIHELGHIMAAIRRGRKPSYPYFIPGPAGTFGAVILSEEPMVERDEIFDIGFSGPIFGFIPAGIAAFLGLLNSYYLPVDVARKMMETGKITAFPSIVILEIFSSLIGRKEGVLLLSPLGFAGYLGLYVTFLNLLPIGQLDGGHVVYAIIKSDKIRSLIMLISWLLLSLVNPAMAILALFLALYFPHPPPLNDVSEMEPKKKAIGLILYLIVLILCAPIPEQLIKLLEML